MTRFLVATALAVCLPIAAHAASSGDSNPPKPTSTTKVCEGGKVWDSKSKSCVAPSSGMLDDDALYDAIRELAYYGQYDHALTALDAMSDQQDDRVLTYRGFAHRKAGNIDTAMALYGKALTANPDNILARSYMGQGLVEMGLVDEARQQLSEIRQRGGRNTWAEYALRTAIEQGRGHNY